MSKRNETAWCCRCRKYTTWSGTDRRVYCNGCGTDFPCSHQCKHWDCWEEKGLAAPDANGVLKLLPARDPLPPSDHDESGAGGDAAPGEGGEV
jgi:hypothetical protein